METNNTLNKVCAMLCGLGYKATVEHPPYILLQFSFADLHIGTANGPWEMDVCIDGDIQNANTGLPADSTVEQVFAWICDEAKKTQKAFNARYL